MTNRRLLVLDDEADFAKFVSRVATSLGYEVEVSTHAYDFQAAILRMEPNVIMLDIVMPDIDGIELLGLLAERQTRARIILMTGFNPKYADIGKRIGSSRLLSDITILLKPISVAELTAVLMNGAKSDRESADDNGCSSQ